MKTWIAAASGVVPGYLMLGLAVVWLRSMCFPVSSHDFKWQCGASFWAVAAAYFGCSFIATFFSERWQGAVGVIAFAVLFLGHALLPDLAIVSFGKRWYLNANTLLFAVGPAVIGAAAAILARRRFSGAAR